MDVSVPLIILGTLRGQELFRLCLYSSKTQHAAFPLVSTRYVPCQGDNAGNVQLLGYYC